MSRKQPFIKFFPADWRADVALHGCSLAARALWLECMGFMHEAEPYGHLYISGVPPTPQRIATAVNAPVDQVRVLLEELERERVLSRTDEGVIFCRRMVRDAEKRAADQENGKKGGNPLLTAPDVVMAPMLDAAAKHSTRQERDRERKARRRAMSADKSPNVRGMSADTTHNSADISAEHSSTKTSVSSDADGVNPPDKAHIPYSRSQKKPSSDTSRTGADAPPATQKGSGAPTHSKRKPVKAPSESPEAYAQRLSAWEGQQGPIDLANMQPEGSA